MMGGGLSYNEHHCPSHDLAGWRKSRVPHPPGSVMDKVPDWVCEITSPGHERKDFVTQLLRLQSFKVPYYWIISPEDKTLIEVYPKNWTVLLDNLRHDNNVKRRQWSCPKNVGYIMQNSKQRSR